MPIPVCPHSYFQSASLTCTWMSHYSWLSMTAPGNPKLYCSVYALRLVHCMGDFCEGCILFLLHLHLLFCFHLTEFLFCQKGPSGSCRTCTFLPSVQKSLCVVPCCLNADNLALAICFFFNILFISTWNGKATFASRSESSPLDLEGRAHTELHTHVCSCLTVTWQLHYITFSHFQNIRVIVIPEQKLPDFEDSQPEGDGWSFYLTCPAHPTIVGMPTSQNIGW